MSFSTQVIADNRAKFNSYITQYAASTVYKSSAGVAELSGVNTDGAFFGMYGEGFGRVSPEATGHYAYNQGGIHQLCNFELTA